MLVKKENLSSILEILQKSRYLSLDTETTGLLQKDRLFSVIISNGVEVYYFNYNTHTGEGHLSGTPIDLIPLLSDPSITWFMQNAKFDLRMLYAEGLEVAGSIICTEALGRVVKNNHLSYKLEDAVKRIGLEKSSSVDEYVTQQGLYRKYKVPGKEKHMVDKFYHKVPLKIMQKYGEIDGDITFKLGMHLMERNLDDSLKPLHANEVRLTKNCFKIERRGIKLNQEYTLNAWQYEKDSLQREKENFKAICGKDYTTGKKELIGIFSRLGVDIPKTDKGNPSLDSEAIEEINHPLGFSLQRIRGIEKKISTYYSDFLFYQHNGRIHPDMRQAGTETGRFSYRTPNLQNLPKEDEPEDLVNPYPVRGCFVPDPGKVFVMLDYKQQEYRMMLDYAGETKLIKAIMEGADVHQATADLIGITRKQAKTVNFMVLYGGGADKLAGMLGITRKEAKDLINLYFARLPKVEQFIWKVTQVGKLRGYVKNWFGRRCHIAKRDWAYILPNHIIQGGCADVIKVAINNVEENHGDNTGIQLTVHDELLLGIDPNRLELIDNVVRVMENVYPSRNGMKLNVDVSHSFKSFAARDKKEGLP